MKVNTIKTKPKWKPELTYNELTALMQHFGSENVFRVIIINRCNTSPTGITAVKWGVTRCCFSVGMSEVSLRIRIPAELGFDETFTKPYAVFVQAPIDPKQPADWSKPMWIWKRTPEDLFKWWLDNCL